ncbi:hypothetical protein Bbelb_091050 [Branchiostoma belcheri]|nr:hypothetical protein Bbelb_091050 [Branchiostoma belcheri]
MFNFETDRSGSPAVKMWAAFALESAFVLLLSCVPVLSDLSEKTPDPFLSPPRVSQMYYDEINRICNSETCSESCGDLSFAQLCYYVTKQGKLERDLSNKTEDLQRQVIENHKNLATELANSTEFLSARVHRLSRDRRREGKNYNKEKRKMDRRVATLEELVGKHQETVTRQADLINNLLKRLDSAERLLYELNEKISTMEAKDCMELRQKNYTRSGIYTITPAFTGVGDGGKGFDVFCDMDTDGGGWTTGECIGALWSSTGILSSAADYTVFAHVFFVYDFQGQSSVVNIGKDPQRTGQSPAADRLVSCTPHCLLKHPAALGETMQDLLTFWLRLPRKSSINLAPRQAGLRTRGHITQG